MIALSTPPGLMVWGSVLVAVGLAGLGVAFLLMRRSVRKLAELKEELR